MDIPSWTQFEPIGLFLIYCVYEYIFGKTFPVIICIYNANRICLTYCLIKYIITSN